jgi:hypothetical protein
MPAVAREHDDRVARDAVEQGGADRCRVQHAVEHQEQVLAGAFAEQTGRGQRDALAETQAPRFARDELAGQIVAAGLRAGRNRVRRETLPARDAGIDACLEHTFAEVRSHLPGGDGDVGRRVRGQAEAAEAAERDRPQIRAVELVSP